MFDRQLLRTKRQEKGISQAQLAEAIGVTPSSISNYERGTRLPPWSVARKLALYFNLPEAAFGYGEEEQPHAAPPIFYPATTVGDIARAVATLASAGWRLNKRDNGDTVDWVLTSPVINSESEYYATLDILAALSTSSSFPNEAWNKILKECVGSAVVVCKLDEIKLE